MSFLIALGAGVVLTPALGAVGVRLGLVDRPGALKIHDNPVPVTGGAAVLVAVLVGVGLSGLSGGGGLGLADRGGLGLAAAASLALAGGLMDDLRPVPPWVRLIVQTTAGILLVAGGYRLEPFAGLGAAALVLATVASCNAVNMVDGQDGLAGGLGAIAAAGLAAVLATIGVSAALPLALAGALLGFLVWNRPPARVFLGDGGAYAIGVFLAASSAQATAVGWRGVLAAGAILGVLAYELASTIVRRLASSASAFRGDRDHSYDRLGDRVRSRSGSTIVMWCLAVVFSAVGVAVVRLKPAAALGVITGIALAAVFLDVRLLPVSLAKEDR